jgi:DNA-binding MarR family transcriptional regulator
MKNEIKVNIGLPPALKQINQVRDSVERYTRLPKSGVYNLRILRSLRRIVRAIDLYSRELKADCGLTVPQLVCLSAIVREKQITAAALSGQVNLSPSTLVGILDRLEKARSIQRVRSIEDRRQVIIKATEAGKSAVRKAPSPLQENLALGLGSLPPDEQAAIAQSLDKIVELMEAHEIKVAPLLTLERKSYVSGTGKKLKGKA